jgi:uncharacterized protein YaeQ
VALTATLHAFEIDLADSDRGVYESLTLRAARHPSESAEYLVARVLAYCLEYAAGIQFSKGLCDPDEPAILVRDPTGALRAWIEIGTPDAGRLHRASKASPRVAVYVHKDPTQFLRSLEGTRIHRADALEIHALDRALVGAFAAALERRMALTISVAEREVFVTLGAATISGAVRRCQLG